MPGGGIVTLTIPLSCLANNGESMTEGHGTWQVRLRRGVPTLEFQILADVYGGRPPSPTDKVTSNTADPASFVGTVRIVGSAPLLSNSVKGEATLELPPDPCFAAFSGPATFTATQIDAVPQTESDKS